MKPSFRSLRVLLLRDVVPNGASTIVDHVHALTRLSNHRVVAISPRVGCHVGSVDLNHFDVVVIHYSLFALHDSYLSESFKQAIEGFSGLKVQFIQDDYRRVDEVAALASRLGVHVLYTLASPTVIPDIWGRLLNDGMRVEHTLAGFVPDLLCAFDVSPLSERPLDIAYRGRELPYFLGRLGQEKVNIAKGVLARADRYRLHCDIAWDEDSRIYGADWLRFLASARCVLGTESGSSIVDFDGKLEQTVADYLTENPGADFDQVSRDILGPFEGNAPLNVISPRMFESIATRTALVLFPGEYSGVLEPERHYIPLAKDFSNFAEVVDQIRDLDHLRALTERCHSDVVQSGMYSFRRFAAEVDTVLLEEHEKRIAVPPVRIGGSLGGEGSLGERIAWSRVRTHVAAMGIVDPATRTGAKLQRWFEIRRITNVIKAIFARSPRSMMLGLRYFGVSLRNQRNRRLFAAIVGDRQLDRMSSLAAAVKLTGLLAEFPGRGVQASTCQRVLEMRSASPCDARTLDQGSALTRLASGVVDQIVLPGSFKAGSLLRNRQVVDLPAGLGCRHAEALSVVLCEDTRRPS